LDLVACDCVSFCSRALQIRRICDFVFVCMLFFFVDLRVDACSMPGVSQIGVTIEHRSIVDCLVPLLW
jgi:hypothetical protein